MIAIILAAYTCHSRDDIETLTLLVLFSCKSIFYYYHFSLTTTLFILIENKEKEKEGFIPPTRSLKAIKS